MTAKCKVSVILTSYNHAKFLRESIDSVLDQTYSDFELIIWDDASTDESWEIVQSYADARVRAFRNETPQRGAANVNRAIREKAQGEYIAIHHSDDVWEPDKLEKQVAFLDARPDIGAVFSRASIVGENGDPFDDQSHFYYGIFDQPNRTRHEWLNYFFHHGNALCHPSVLLRKSCYEDCGPYRYGLAQLPDFDMWVRLCLKYEIHILPERLVRFRVRSREFNVSGDRRENRIRGNFELVQILGNYNRLESPEEFIQVFPTAKTYFGQEGLDIGFALGMLSLAGQTSRAREFFGLTLLFQALNDHDRARKINDLYGFGHQQFAALTAMHDVFGVELLHGLQVLVTQKEQAVSALTDQVAQLTELTRSDTWRLAKVLDRVRVRLAPANSRRARVLGQLLHIIFFPFRTILRSRRFSADLALVRASGFFDPAWYLDTYADVAEARVDPARHYLQTGGFERRDPGPQFRSGWYLDTYEDVRTSRRNPLVHYLTSGRAGGRAPQPVQRSAESPALRVPSGYLTISGAIAMPQNKKTNEIAIVLHLFYKDLLDEIKQYVQNIGRFDIYISTPPSKGEYEHEIFEAFPEARILYTENRGRDILPFVSIYRNIRSLNYKYLLKIHTKKTPHRQDGTAWRADVYGKLMGSMATISSVMSAFENDPTIGIVGPKGHVIDYQTYRGANRHKTELLAGRVGIDLQKGGSFDFVAGSMFWARPDALRYLALLPLDPEEIEPEPLEPDGSFVHALERFVGLSARMAGYSVCEVDQQGNISDPANNPPNKAYPFGLPLRTRAPGRAKMPPSGDQSGSGVRRLSTLLPVVWSFVGSIYPRRKKLLEILIQAVKNPRDASLVEIVRNSFRRRLIESRRKAESETRTLAVPDPIELTEQLGEKLQQHMLYDEYVISLSHDSYLTITGGVQNKIADEQASSNSHQISYLHIYPQTPNPRLLGEHEPLYLGINCDGANIGLTDRDGFLAAISQLRSKKLKNVYVHHTMGFDMRLVSRILSELSHKKGEFWLHDNFSLCPSYYLLRNDMEYCGAPDIKSNACSICVYVGLRREQQPAFTQLFLDNEMTVVAPSQYTLDFWKSKFPIAPASEKVLPLARLEWNGTAPARKASDPLRVGFIGYPVRHKGWATWQQLTDRFADDDRYRFFLFSSMRGAPGNYRQVMVSVSKDNRLSMVHALTRHEIDVAFLWSLCPETFSFSLYESLAAGCFALTYKDSGNIQAYLRQNPNRGIIVETEHALFRLFSNGDLHRRVTDYQKSGRPQAQILFLSGSE